MTMISNSVQNIKKFKFFENAFLPKIVTIPLCQEKDIRFESLVKKGDIVKEGDIIASDLLTKSASIHSPIPGEVLDVVSCIAPNGKKEYSVKIKLQGQLSYLGKKNKVPDYQFLTKDELITRLNKNGVVNTFQTLEPSALGTQISKLKDESDKVIVVRLFDEDETRITDSLVSNFFYSNLIEAANILASIIHSKGVVFVKNNLNQFAISKDVKIYENNVFLNIKNRKYPYGFKRDIIKEFNKSLKKQVSYKIDDKSLYIDSSTLYDVYKVLVEGIPCTSKYVLFSGNCINSSCILNVRIGSSIKEIVNQIGGFTKKPGLIVINGMICGSSASTLDIPITKYVKSVYLVSNTKFTDGHIYSCINCGNCRYSCPGGVSPDVIYANTVNSEKPEEKYEMLALACMGCGICNEVCPARLPLSQIMMVLKNKRLGTIDEK